MLIVPESTEHLELTDVRLILLSEGINQPSKLRKLAVLGLKMGASVIDSALQNNKDDIDEAAYRVLMQWRVSQPDKWVAYKQICEALRRVRMDMLITKMNDQQ